MNMSIRGIAFQAGNNDAMPVTNSPLDFLPVAISLIPGNF